MKKTHSRNNKQRVRKRDGNYCIGVRTAIGKKENQLEVVKKNNKHSKANPEDIAMDNCAV